LEEGWGINRTPTLPIGTGADLPPSKGGAGSFVGQAVRWELGHAALALVGKQPGHQSSTVMVCEAPGRSEGTGRILDRADSSR